MQIGRVSVFLAVSVEAFLLFSCGKGEQGPAGLQGPTGATGAQGAIGPTGAGGPNDVAGNLTMVDSTPTAGNLIKDGARFLHNFGIHNTFLGTNAGNFAMTGGENTASGVNALFSNTTGNENTASGSGALGFNTTGGGNTASGFSALQSNTTGYSNTASGVNALLFNTTGNNNTASGAIALQKNTTGGNNTASGSGALYSNTAGSENTASGCEALVSNTTGSNNTAVGFGANVSAGNLVNATAIGSGAIVNASNKVRVGNTLVTVIEGQVGFTASSDVHQKENFQPIDGEKVLGKLQGLKLTSWNFIGHDPKHFRHYGPMAQDFFAAFGHDGVGTIGTDTTITSTDMDGILMIAAQALERRSADLRAENAQLKARLDSLERRMGDLALTEAE